MKYFEDIAAFLCGVGTVLVIIIALVAMLGCRIVHVEVHAEPDSTVIIDAELQADKPMDFKGGGLKIPLLP